MKFIQNVKANTKPKYFTNYIIILVMLAVTLMMKMTGIYEMPHWTDDFDAYVARHKEA